MASWLAAANALAHDPFDCSSRVVVKEDRIELTVTMGLEGAKQFLQKAGLTPEAVAEALRTRAPYLRHGLPATLTARLFEVKSGGETLAATNITGLSDGVEVVFHATYTRPQARVLEFHALYFNGIEQMKHGAFIAVDGEENQLGAALLSRANVAVQIPTAVVAPTNAALQVDTAETNPPRK